MGRYKNEHKRKKKTRKEYLSHSARVSSPRDASARADPTCLKGSFHSEPETTKEPTKHEHLYSQNFIWTFEDIHTLIDNDLPIFGDEDRPCIILTSREASESINVLIGLDYWLDFMMCHVPEVLMCYHLDSIVQKYGPMITEELPNLEQSKFSPEVLQNAAQNILSFLKLNATKSGHTYWLFKRPDEDLVKLYDLTSLCPDNIVVDSPFKTPVAMLLYKIARNVRLNNSRTYVMQLLEHVLNLLKEETYPQIAASSHYMLADLYVPATINPARPEFEGENGNLNDEEAEYTAFMLKIGISATAEDDSSKDEDEATDVIVDEEGNGKVVIENRETAVINDLNIISSEESNANCNKTTDDVTEHKERDTQTNDNKTLVLQTSENIIVSEEITKNINMKTISSKGMNTTLPMRIGLALTHALKGIQALDHLTVDKSKMINPSEQIKMAYSYIWDTKKKEQDSTSKKKKEKSKINERSSNNAAEIGLNKTDKTNSDLEISPDTEQLDIDDILIQKEKNSFPSRHEPPKDENFAWKLYLKILLYEKICLSYTTLAEYSYSVHQYGFCLKYIDMACKCQKLLSNMLIEMKVVKVSYLLRRAGDTIMCLKKHWKYLEKFKLQFIQDDIIDIEIKEQIADDMIKEVKKVKSDEFDLNIALPGSETEALHTLCNYYKRAIELCVKNRPEIQKKLASVYHQIALIHMEESQRLAKEYGNEKDIYSKGAKALHKKYSEKCQRTFSYFDDALDLFREAGDNCILAQIYCDKAGFLLLIAEHERSDGFCAVKRNLFDEAEKLYIEAKKLTDVDNSVFEMVNLECFNYFYQKACLLKISPVDSLNAELAETLDHALKCCQLGPRPPQDFHQFHAATIYQSTGNWHRIQYNVATGDGPKRRIILYAARANYEEAASIYAKLETTHFYLSVSMEHVALMMDQAVVSPNLLLKSLRKAVQIMRQCDSVMELLKVRVPTVPKFVKQFKTDPEYITTQCYELLCDYEHRLHCCLKNIMLYCRSKSEKSFDKMTDMYKKLYGASLQIKRSENIKEFAASICDVLKKMSDIDCCELCCCVLLCLRHCS